MRQESCEGRMKRRLGRGEVHLYRRLRRLHYLETIFVWTCPTQRWPVTLTFSAAVVLPRWHGLLVCFTQLVSSNKSVLIVLSLQRNFNATALCCRWHLRFSGQHPTYMCFSKSKVWHFVLKDCPHRVLCNRNLLFSESNKLVPSHSAATH